MSTDTAALFTTYLLSHRALPHFAAAALRVYLSTPSVTISEDFLSSRVSFLETVLTIPLSIEAPLPAEPTTP